MYVRWIGALLIFASCGSVGFLKSGQFRTEERYIRDFIRILDHMTCELEYHLSPLPQICESACKMTFGCLQEIFHRLSLALEEQTASNVECCMHDVILQVQSVPNTLQDLLLVFAKSLGRYDLDGQLLQISAVREDARFLMDKIRSEGKERIRNYQTLGICAGLGLAILLL